MDESSRGDGRGGGRGKGRGGRGRGGSGRGRGGRGGLAHGDEDDDGDQHTQQQAQSQPPHGDVADAPKRILLKRGEGSAPQSASDVRHDHAPSERVSRGGRGGRGGGRGGRGGSSADADAVGPQHQQQQQQQQQQHQSTTQGGRSNAQKGFAAPREDEGEGKGRGGASRGPRGGGRGGREGGARDEPRGADAADAKRRKEEDDKKKADTEAQRKAEEAERARVAEMERIAQEEAAQKQRDEEEAKRKEEAERRELEEKRLAMEAEKEAIAREEAFRTLRAANTSAWAAGGRPDESFFRNLDSSLKRNTAFVKKLKTMTGEQSESLCNELKAVNLTKYVSEAVGAIAEAKLKLTDVIGAVKVCSLLHQRYAEFTPLLYSALQKQMSAKEALKDEDRPARILRLRVLLRLAGELVVAGVFNEHGIVVSTVRELCALDAKEHAFSAVLVAFCKSCGGDLVGLVPSGPSKRVLPEGQAARDPILRPDVRQVVSAALASYCESLSAHAIRDHKELKERERRNSTIIQTKGELSEELRDRYEKQLKAFDKLLASATSLAELVGAEPPNLPKDETSTRVDAPSFLEIYTPAQRGEGAEGDSFLWEDEEQRAFYEDIPDLRAFVPAVLFGSSAVTPAATTASTADVGAAPAAPLSTDDKGVSGDAAGTSAEADAAIDAEAAEAALAAAMKELMIDDDSGDESKGASASAPGNDGRQRAAASAAEVDAMLQRLPTCMNRKDIDELATAFCYNNSKGARKRLIRALFAVPRNRTDLLPFYSRLAAVLKPCIPEIGDSLVSMLLGEFRRDQTKKDQTNVEDKLRVLRYLGELAKFGVVPKQEALNVLKRLLDTFTHHNIDCACVLLETCGRFLFRSPDSHVRTRNLLEVMMRKRSVQHMDSRQSGMIESAFYYCNPPERQKKAKKVRPPLVAYVRHLLYDRLDSDSTEEVLRQLRRLPWNSKWQSAPAPKPQQPQAAQPVAEGSTAAPAEGSNPSVDPEAKEDAGAQAVRYVVRCLCRPWKMKFGNIQNLASIASGLAKYHDEVQVLVVDATLEDVRLGLEVNIPKWNQRRISVVRYFGELYNYRLCESVVVFETLYRVLFFGHNMSESGRPLYAPPSDAADDYFRVRLVCSLLDTCGQFFGSGSSSKKLDCFLAYFQRYYWSKVQPLPIDIEFTLTDMYESVRPKARRPSSYEDAAASVAGIEMEMLNKAGVVKEKERQANDEEGSESSSSEDNEDEDDEESDVSSAGTVGPAEAADEDGSDEGSSDDGSDDDGGDRSDDLGSADEDEDDSDSDAVLLRKRQAAEKKEVDEEFLAEYNRLMTESIEQRRAEVGRAPVLDVAVPMHLRGAASRVRPAVDDHGDGDEEPRGAVMFTLLTKKGNKQQLRELEVPADSSFASAAMSQQKAAMDEKNEMKRLVLQYEEHGDYEEDPNGDDRGGGPAHGGHGYRGRGGHGGSGRMNQKNRRLLQSHQVQEFHDATQSQQVYFGQPPSAHGQNYHPQGHGHGQSHGGHQASGGGARGGRGDGRRR